MARRALLALLASALSHPLLAHPAFSARHTTTLPPTRAFPSTPLPADVNIHITELGGDPTGATDSTAAFVAALALVANRSAGFYGAGPNVDGAGRVTIDLGGGAYLISAPLVASGAAFHDFSLAHGTLIASPTFPPDRFMLEASSSAGLVLEDLTMDAARTGGCVKLSGTMQTVITRAFFLHYTTIGVWGTGAGGHELFIDSCTFAELQFGEPGFNVSSAKTGVAVWFDMPDSSVTNSVIRCSRVGIVDRGGANYFSGVHVYATCSKDAPGPDDPNVCPAFLGDAPSSRVVGCYFDNSPGVLTSIANQVVTSTLLYGSSGLVFAPQTTGAPAHGLLVQGNSFVLAKGGGGGGGNDAAEPLLLYDTTNGTVNTSALLGVVVADNAFDDAGAERSTRPSLTLAVGGNATSGWLGTVDLRPLLMFPPTAGGEGGDQPGAGQREDAGPLATPPAAWRTAIAFVNALLAQRGEPLLGTRPVFRARSGRGGSSHGIMGVGDAYGGAVQRFTGAVTILSGAGSLESFGLWGVTPTSTPGVVSAFVTIGSNGELGLWSALLHLEFDQSAATASGAQWREAAAGHGAGRLSIAAGGWGA
jgi:hypothetical protein